MSAVTKTLPAWMTRVRPRVYLIDTNIISEARKGSLANPGVQAFFRQAMKMGTGVFLSVMTVGELRRGIDHIRHRGDTVQANCLDAWLTMVVDEYHDYILPIDQDIAQVWGRLRVPH